jgi:transcription initiation factor TFIID TATA-box-binding protein
MNISFLYFYFHNFQFFQTFMCAKIASPLSALKGYHFGISNVVTSSSLEQSVNLSGLGNSDLVSYDPMSYPCAYVKGGGMHGKVSLFSSGKMISVGTHSFSESKEDLNYVVNWLSEKGLIRPVRAKFELQNIVATVDLHRTIDLNKFAQEIDNVIFEPEQFPGAMWRPSGFRLSVLVYASGKLVIAGVKSYKEPQELMDNAVNLISNYTY